VQASASEEKPKPDEIKSSNSTDFIVGTCEGDEGEGTYDMVTDAERSTLSPSLEDPNTEQSTQNPEVIEGTPADPVISLLEPAPCKSCSSLTLSVKELSETLSAVKLDRNELQARNLTLEATAADFASQSQFQSERFRDLEKDLLYLQEELANREKSVDQDLIHRSTRLQEELACLKMELHASETKRTQIEGNNVNYECQIVKVKSELNEKNDELKELFKVKEILEKDLERERQRNQQTEKENQGLKQLLHNLESLQGIDTKDSAQGTSLDDMGAVKGQYADRDGRIESDPALHSLCLAEKDSIVAHYERELSSLKDQMRSESTKAIKEVEASLLETQQKLMRTEKELSSSQLLMQFVSNLPVTEDGRISALTSTAQDLAVDADIRISELERSVWLEKERANTAESKLSTKEMEVLKLYNELEDQALRLKNADRDVTKLREHIAILEQRQESDSFAPGAHSQLEIDQARRQIRALETEKQTLEDRVEVLIGQSTSSIQRAERLMAEREETSSSLSRLRDANAELTAQLNDSTNRRVAAAQSEALARAVVEELRNEVNSLRESMQNVQVSSTRWEEIAAKSNHRCNELEGNMHDLEFSLKASNQSLENARQQIQMEQELRSNLQRENTEILEELKALQNNLAKLQNEKESLEHKVEAYQHTNQSAQTELNRYHQVFSQGIDDQRHLEESYSNLKANLSVLNQNYDSACSQYEQLQLEYSRVIQERDEVISAHENLVAEYARARTIIDELTCSPGVEERVKSHESSVMESMDLKLQKLRRTLAARDDEVKLLKQEIYSNDIQQLQSSQQLETDHKAILGMNYDEDHEALIVEIARLNGIVENLENKIVQQAAQSKSALEQCHRAQQAREEAEFEFVRVMGKLTTLTQENDTLVNQLELASQAAESSSLHVLTLQNELQQVHQKLVGTSMELEQLRSSRSSFTEQRGVSEQQIVELRCNLRQLEEDKALVDAQLSETRNQLILTQRTFENEKRKTTSARSSASSSPNVEALRQSRKPSNEEPELIQELRRQLQSRDQQVIELRAQYQALVSQFDTLSNKSSDLKQAVRAKMNILMTRERDIDKVQKEFEELEREYLAKIEMLQQESVNLKQIQANTDLVSSQRDQTILSMQHDLQVSLDELQHTQLPVEPVEANQSLLLMNVPMHERQLEDLRDQLHERDLLLIEQSTEIEKLKTELVCLQYELERSKESFNDALSEAKLQLEDALSRACAAEANAISLAAEADSSPQVNESNLSSMFVSNFNYSKQEPAETLQSCAQDDWTSDSIQQMAHAMNELKAEYQTREKERDDLTKKIAYERRYFVKQQAEWNSKKEKLEKEIEESRNAKSKSSSLVEEKAKHYRAKYLREATHRASLVQQKRYLTSVLRTYRQGYVLIQSTEGGYQ
jgi:chromosome segregation ATPase